ncbi:MAG: GNAT family N-acetyltransferase [Polyangiales bacterium]
MIEKDGVRIRRATENDVEGVRTLFRETYGDSYPYRSFFDQSWLLRSILSDDLVVLVAEDVATGVLLGTASVVVDVGAHSDLTGEFGRLAVSSAARSRGIGKMLMDARVDAVRDRLHVGLVENRTLHHHSQRISLAAGFAPVGVLPQKHVLERRESVALFVRLFGPALDLRRNHPRVVPEIHRLAQAALRSVGLAPDTIVDEESPPYPAGALLVADEMTSEGMPMVLRIERGRVHRREVFGPVRLHYGLFKLAAKKANYVVARLPEVQGGAVAGAVGWIFDPVEKNARVFELIADSDAAIRFLLEQVVTRAHEQGVVYLEIDVSAYAPSLQRTLVELGFVAAAYVPAMVFENVERLDVVRMVKLFAEPDLSGLDVVEPVRPFLGLVEQALRREHVLPQVAEAIERLPLFEGLSREQAQRLASEMTLERYRGGEALFSSGDAAKALFVILDGVVDVERQDRVIGRVLAGDVLGERGLLEGGDHGSTAKAARDLTVAMLTEEALHALTRQRPDVAVVLYRNLARGLGRKLDAANG